MKSPKDQYTNDIRKQFGYVATWLPGVPLKLGDVGVLKDNAFTRVTGLEEFKIPMEEISDQTEDDLEYASQGSVTVSSKISGAISPQGSTLGNIDAGFIVDFSQQNSIYFKVNQAKVSMVKNSIEIGEKIIELFKQGKWHRRWVVITEVVKVKSATILISNSSSAKIELKANANADAVKLDIADAKFDFSSAFLKGLEVKIIGQQGLTPLFKIKGLKTRIFMPPGFIDRGINAFDLLTPEKAKTMHSDDVYFDYVVDEN